MTENDEWCRKQLSRRQRLRQLIDAYPKGRSIELSHSFAEELYRELAHVGGADASGVIDHGFGAHPIGAACSICGTTAISGAGADAAPATPVLEKLQADVETRHDRHFYAGGTELDRGKAEAYRDVLNLIAALVATPPASSGVSSLLDRWNYSGLPSVQMFNHAVDVANANYRRAEAAEKKLGGVSEAPRREWHYHDKPVADTDCRKLVTLLESGMVWVGIRAYAPDGNCWLNNGEPERAMVLAWQDIPEPASKRWVRGQLV